MIVGISVDSTEAKRGEGAPKTLNLNLSLTDVQTKDEDVSISYTFTVDYGNKSTITLSGKLFAKEDKALVKKLSSSWKKDKKIPTDYAEMVLNFLTTYGVANATILAKVINMPPPLPIGKIKVNK